MPKRKIIIKSSDLGTLDAKRQKIFENVKVSCSTEETTGDAYNVCANSEIDLNAVEFSLTEEDSKSCD